MPEGIILPAVTLPVEISPALLAKIREAREEISPGKTLAVTLALDDTGTLTAKFGYRPKRFGWLKIGAFFGVGKDRGRSAGLEAKIEF